MLANSPGFVSITWSPLLRTTVHPSFPALSLFLRQKQKAGSTKEFQTFTKDSKLAHEHIEMMELWQPSFPFRPELQTREPQLL